MVNPDDPQELRRRLDELKSRQATDKAAFDARASEQPLAVGAHVWLRDFASNRGLAAPALAPKVKGPFRLLLQLNGKRWVVRNLCWPEDRPKLAHVDDMRLVRARLPEADYASPSPGDGRVSDQQAGGRREVDHVVDHVVASDGTITYAVHWMGLPFNRRAPHTWQPEANLDACPDALRAYWAARASEEMPVPEEPAALAKAVVPPPAEAQVPQQRLGGPEAVPEPAALLPEPDPPSASGTSCVGDNNPHERDLSDTQAQLIRRALDACVDRIRRDAAGATSGEASLPRLSRRRRKSLYAQALQGPNVAPLYEEYVRFLEEYRSSSAAARATRQVPMVELVRAAQSICT